MTGKARERAHKAQARARVQQADWDIEAEHESNGDALKATAFLGRSTVTAFFQTGERRAARVLRNFIRAL